MATYTKEVIKNLLETNDAAVMRALIVLYRRQTASEQSAESTHEHNGVGFTAFDAHLLTSFAKQVIQWESSRDRRYPTALSSKQIQIARKRLAKYSQQLANEANERSAA